MDFELLKQDSKPIKDTFKVYNCVEIGSPICGNDLEDIKIKLKNTDHTHIKEEDFDALLEKISEEDLKSIEITFQKPDFKTNTLILSQALTTHLDGTTKADTIAYNKFRIFYTVKGWSLQSKDKPLPVTIENINQLHPNVVDAILEKLNKNVPHYFGSIIV